MKNINKEDELDGIKNYEEKNKFKDQLKNGNNLKKKEHLEWKTIGKFALRTIPVYIIAIILVFNPLTRINSLGMTLVWGRMVLYIYNLTITKAVLKLLTK